MVHQRRRFVYPSCLACSHVLSLTHGAERGAPIFSLHARRSGTDTRTHTHTQTHRETHVSHTPVRLSPKRTQVRVCVCVWTCIALHRRLRPQSSPPTLSPPFWLISPPPLRPPPSAPLSAWRYTRARMQTNARAHAATMHRGSRLSASAFSYWRQDR